MAQITIDGHTHQGTPDAITTTFLAIANIVNSGKPAMLAVSSNYADTASRAIYLIGASTQVRVDITEAENTDDAGQPRIPLYPPTEQL